MGKELGDDIHRRVSNLCREGDAFVEVGKFGDAETRYMEAWALLPDPKEEWDAATWIQSALGDTQFLAGRFDHALAAFGTALRCPGGQGNPFVHLRLWESSYELGNMAKADDELTKAYMGAGKEIFEAEDPKYFRRLQGVLKSSPGSPSL